MSVGCNTPPLTSAFSTITTERRDEHRRIGFDALVARDV
jgi:hypothetical protein